MFSHVFLLSISKWDLLCKIQIEIISNLFDEPIIQNQIFTESELLKGGIFSYLMGFHVNFIIPNGRRASLGLYSNNVLDFHNCWAKRG